MLDYEVTQKEYNEITKEVLSVILREGLMDMICEELDITEEYFEQILAFEE